MVVVGGEVVVIVLTREFKDNSQVFGLSNWRAGIAIKIYRR